MPGPGMSVAQRLVARGAAPYREPTITGEGGMQTKYRQCTFCYGSGQKQNMSPTDSSTTCSHCSGTGRVMEYVADQPEPKDTTPREPVPFYIWFFGAVGALIGGYAKPWGLAWYIEAFFGFIIAGFLAGVLNQFRIGRIILIVIAVGFVALIGAGIWSASTGAGQDVG